MFVLKMKIIEAWKSWYLPNATSDEIGQQGGKQPGGEGDNKQQQNKQCTKQTKTTKQTKKQNPTRQNTTVDQQSHQLSDKPDNSENHRKNCECCPMSLLIVR